jgi:flagellin
LNVADGALNNIQLILQRIRSLVVEANSDLNSQNDLENIQTEINQLLLEINTISTNTNFNGLSLFTGQFQTAGEGSTTIINRLGQGTLTDMAVPYTNPVTGATGYNSVFNGSSIQPFISPLVSSLTSGAFVPTYSVWSIISASNNMFDPDSQSFVGPGVLVEEEVYSTASNFGPSPLFVDYSALPVDLGGFQIPIPTPDAINFNVPVGGPGQIFSAIFSDIGNLQEAVGAQAAFLTQLPIAQVTGNALTVNDGGDEGQIVAINLPEINTEVLNVSGINVLDPDITTVNPQNVATATPAKAVVTGVSSSNVMNASLAEYQLDQALQSISSTRAQVGAQTVALQQDADNDNTAAVNLTATESNIRDANIGQTVTDLTQQQILVSVGTSVLSQLDVNAQQLTALLLNSFAGFPAA